MIPSTKHTPEKRVGRSALYERTNDYPNEYKKEKTDF
jgi:hypothetical protein